MDRHNHRNNYLVPVHGLVRVRRPPHESAEGMAEEGGWEKAVLFEGETMRIAFVVFLFLIAWFILWSWLDESRARYDREAGSSEVMGSYRMVELGLIRADKSLSELPSMIDKMKERIHEDGFLLGCTYAVTVPQECKRRLEKDLSR